MPMHYDEVVLFEERDFSLIISKLPLMKHCLHHYNLDIVILFIEPFVI
jgi:hypothetical protein